VAGDFIRPIVCEVADVPDLEMFGPFPASSLPLTPLAGPSAPLPFAASCSAALRRFTGALQQTFGMVYLTRIYLHPLRLPLAAKKTAAGFGEKRDRLICREGALSTAPNWCDS
jgi:hypothetical protein